MEKINLHKLQMIQLEALKEVDRLCKKHSIKYYMIGGTLIGAVRHKGFIPWDDDIDIAMMRRDYDKFLKCCQSDLQDKYFIQNYQTDVDIYHALTRVCILGTYVDDKQTEHLKFRKEAYIDIFPLDRVPDDNKLLKRQERIIKIIDRLMQFKACIVYRRGFLSLKFVAKKIIRYMMLPIPLKTLQQFREKTMKEYSGQNTLRVCSTASKYGYKKQVMQQSIYGEPVLLEFEDGMYYAPQNWNAYLNHLFGDYMTLPPEDQRNSDYIVYKDEVIWN